MNVLFHTPAALPSGKQSPVLIGLEAGWFPGWYGLCKVQNKIPASARYQTQIFWLSSLLTRQLSCTKMSLINSDTGSIVVKLRVWDCTYTAEYCLAHFVVPSVTANFFILQQNIKQITSIFGTSN